ncbi:hypothetical protein CYMTET_14992 [Cymbomonas tetramitiformis]|uniref:Uncharacterized protein n=1 Tax=Cymbomonas tetramitiformis TaxID=36881 RepID=A0AAE0GF54_9CHLO|nr:hypothetical protein CYMTET_14992 [Cymbomonas tetramitiformis]|eukprot:gene15452-18294_t
MWRYRNYVAVVASISFGGLRRSECSAKEPSRQGVAEEIAKIRTEEAFIRQKWIKDEEGWHKLPARAWPPYQPGRSLIPDLRSAYSNCGANAVLSDQCKKVTFDLGSALIFNGVDPPQGLQQYMSLAEAGDPNGMVGAGVVLVGGLGVPRDESKGVSWLQRAHEAGHPQGHYELAVCYYTGDGVEEDESRAFCLFQKAAAQSHMGGQFMVGDCLMDGAGCEKDEARAIPWIYAAALQGHRQARGRILSLLDEYSK